MKENLIECSKCKNHISKYGISKHFKFCNGIKKTNIHNNNFIKSLKDKNSEFYNCPKCKDKINKIAISRHLKVCKGIFKNQRRHKNHLSEISIKINDNLYECIKCKKQYSFKGIGSHYFRSHTENGKNLICKGHFISKNYVSWNKGKTKETDKRILKDSEDKKLKYKLGILKPTFKGKKHSKETREKWKLNPNMGGLRERSGRGIKGNFLSFRFDSSWELAYIVYNLENNIYFKRNKEFFKYNFEDKERKYYPDFILENGSYVEIKGYFTKQVEAKIEQFPKDKKLILIGKQEIKKYLDYVISKYGKYFIEKLKSI